MADIARLPSGAAALAPHDPDAEAAVLSALMIRPALIDEVRDIIEPPDFYLAAHRLVMDALIELDAAGTEIDMVTLPHRLRSKPGRWEQIGGAPFLAQLSDSTPSVANIVEHARIIRHLAALRRMRGKLHELAITAQAPETRANVAGFLERCEAEVFAVSAGTAERESGSMMSELMTTAAIDLDPARPRQQRGISTGLRDLDALTHGLVPGELWYLAARPGMGKTALALGIAASVAQTGRHAVVFSLEMQKADLGERLLSRDSGVPYKAIQKRELTLEQWTEVALSAERSSHLPIMLDDASTLTPSRLRSRLRRYASALRGKYHGQLALVVVDYVQLMAWDKPSGSRNDDLEHISRALKILAGELGITVIACAQLNRGARDRATADKRPDLRDLRGSGALEQDADKVLFVHRDEGEERGEAELILGKGRNAPLGRITVRWEPWCVRFCEAQSGFDFGRIDYD